MINPANKNLEVRESMEGILINRLTQKEVKSADEMLDIMVAGDEVRNIAETKLNEASSRSHTIFRINIQSKLKAGNDGSIKFS